MNRCRHQDCIAPAPEGQSRCEAHRLRWLPGKPVEQPPVSPWVRRALAGQLPPRAA